MVQLEFAVFGNDTVMAYVRERLAASGFACVGDCASADVVFTYFTTSSALEDAYFDEEGLIKNAKERALLIDLSACSPSLSRELAAVATVNDLRFVEAPIAVIDPVGPRAFQSPENIVCFCAGEDSDMSDVIELLDIIADDVRPQGGCGSAQLAKAVHTIERAAQIGAAVEGDALARIAGSALGVDNSRDVGAYSSELMELVYGAVRNDEYTGTYTVEMLMGEIVAAMTAADDVDLILPQLESILHLLEIVAVIGGADMSPAALSLVYHEEETSAAHGLDWSRAEGLFSDEGIAHGHAHESSEGFGDYDDFGYSGGFGGYSAN